MPQNICMFLFINVILKIFLVSYLNRRPDFPSEWPWAAQTAEYRRCISCFVHVLIAARVDNYFCARSREISLQKEYIVTVRNYSGNFLDVFIHNYRIGHSSSPENSRTKWGWCCFQKYASSRSQITVITNSVTQHLTPTLICNTLILLPISYFFGENRSKVRACKWPDTWILQYSLSKIHQPVLGNFMTNTCCLTLVVCRSYYERQQSMLKRVCFRFRMVS